MRCIFSGSLGVVYSPNYPENYPDDIDSMQTIEVDKGNILSIEFTAFDVEHSSSCDYDHLTIIDGDGTRLMEKSCGSDGNLVIGNQTITSTLPPAIKSWSNSVNFLFVTDGSSSRSGWSINWTAESECRHCSGESTSVEVFFLGGGYLFTSDSFDRQVDHRIYTD